MADTTSENLHKDLEILMLATTSEYKVLKVTDLSWLWHLKRDIFEGEWCAFGFKDGDLVFLGEIVRHLVAEFLVHEADRSEVDLCCNLLIRNVSTEVLLVIGRWVGGEKLGVSDAMRFPVAFPASQMSKMR